MKKDKINATTLRIIMISIILAITMGTIFTFYLVQKTLLESALTAKGNLGATTNISDESLAPYSPGMIGVKEVGNKTSVLSVSKSDYQNQAIKDLNKYASISGVVIDGGFNFTRPVLSETSGQNTVGPLTTEPVVITIANPVPFANFIKFIKLIENNIPIMQITGINIHTAQDSKTDIITDPLTIEVLTR